MGFLKEFRDFATKGSVMDLAVGVVIGAAFSKIVTSFVGDVIMPLINPLIPGGDWRMLEVGNGIKVGSFMGNIVDFIIIALSIFLVVKTMNRLKRKEEAKPATPAEPPAQEKLLTEIRDLLKQK